MCHKPTLVGVEPETDNRYGGHLEPSGVEDRLIAVDVLLHTLHMPGVHAPSRIFLERRHKARGIKGYLALSAFTFRLGFFLLALGFFPGFI